MRVEQSVKTTSSPLPRRGLLARAGGFLFRAAVGVIFGYYQAREAARLNPIETLHSE